MLIVLSDHNDPAVTNDARVPLIIKLPGLEQRIDFDGRWSHVEFLPLFEELLQMNSFDLNTIMSVVNKLAPAGE